MVHESDRKLRQDILDELDFDPTLDARHVGIAVDNGVVTLSGHVRNHIEQVAVEKAVHHTHGVRAVAGHIDVRPIDEDGPAGRPDDDEIAQRAMNILHWDNSIPNENIQIEVNGGVVTLGGEVPWHFQRTAAEEAVRKFCSPRGIVNNIIIRPRAQAGNIQKLIEEALRRKAGIDHSAIRVSVREGTAVVLEGAVGSLAERKAAEDAAWCALGVESVDNRLTVAT